MFKYQRRCGGSPFATKRFLQAKTLTPFGNFFIWIYDELDCAPTKFLLAGSTADLGESIRRLISECGFNSNSP
jgi:hypothetical protein